MTMKPKELLDIKQCRFEYRGDAALLSRPVSGFSIDSRSIQPGEIFIAIKGERFDGHQFIPDMAKNNQRICVVSRTWLEAQESHYGYNLLVVDDTLLALQEISHYHRMKFQLPVLALTGSNGKTTTKEMVSNVLSAKFQVHKNKGNLNNHVGVPLSLLSLEQGHTVAVIEMGTSNFGEIARLAEIAAPTHGLITNIGPAHLEFFGSLQGVSKAKRELWDYLSRDGQTAFVNVDDPNLCDALPDVRKVVTFGFERPANVQGRFIGLDQDGRASFTVNNTEIKLGISGMHNIYNALAAVAVGLEFDLNMVQVKTALEKFLPTSKRMEIIRHEGIVIINDCYNSNPASAKKALQTLSQTETRGRRIAVLADMLELGQWAEQEHKGIGEYVVALNNIDFLLTVGPMSTHTTETAARLGLKNAIHFATKQALVNHLRNIVQENDLVLVKGSRGMAMEDVTNHIAGH
ncbi:MAG: UDP-N-acetylmuramoyl-tripeptide--D-alanyl-D-alanine ligase [Candidatus Zhuqueibacterota bacterium]